MAKVAAYKKEIVKKVAKLMKEYPIIAAVNMETMPSAQLQRMRANLRGKMELFMTKRRFMKLAIEQLKQEKQGIEHIEKYLQGMPALMFTKENPFSIYNIIKKSKSAAPAKPGQISPRDITVPAGPTPFAPGPIIGELGAVGIKAGIEGGKVVIKQDALIVKQGQVIDDKRASMLQRLGVEPMEIGLNIVAIYEGGIIYESSVLDIDEEKFSADLAKAAQQGMNLAVEIAYASKDTIMILIQKASSQAKNLGMEAAILNEETTALLLAKAEAEAQSVASKVNL